MQIADMKFLVAEEDDFQRRWLVVMLANLGVENILEVKDGLAALKMLKDRTNHIDVSIIAIAMPEMDGIELIRHIAKENHPGSIILASALDRSLLFSVESMSHAYGVDLLGSIENPVTPESLLALLTKRQSRADRRDFPGEAPTLTFADIHGGLVNSEFEPLFQPKVELATGQVKGAEAFTRWSHPEYGLVSPSVFIPVLEELGEMDAFAWIIIKKSITACAQWHKLGFLISVSINLSPSCLAKPEFSRELINFVATQELEPQYIVIELTESATVANIPYSLENLVRLRMKGFGISVDNYGTGHSSMQQLLRIPFSELKIDRSFVAGAYTNHALELVLSASLDVCRKLDKFSVAVGVETQQDWDFLRKLGCTHAQGYYIAKPMVGAILPSWMDEWSHFF
ncbi:MAG: EAL domain-containing protein [Burkholderiales bacterium]